LQNVDSSEIEDEDYYVDDDDDEGCYDEDEGSDYEFDDTDFNQHLADKFDDLDLPPGVEAPVPWLQKPDDGPGNFKTMEEIEDEIGKRYKFFKQFDTVEDFSDHKYADKPVGKVTSCAYKHIASVKPFLHSDAYFFRNLTPDRERLDKKNPA
jgi:ubiquitin-conjugating enzyme E2 O